MSARRILVVGSGASGVHFAETALNKGYEVTLLAVGREPPAQVLPDARFAALKDRLDDPAEYFHGRTFESAATQGGGAGYTAPPRPRLQALERFGRAVGRPVHHRQNLELPGIELLVQKRLHGPQDHRAAIVGRDDNRELHASGAAGRRAAIIAHGGPLHPSGAEHSRGLAFASPL